MKLLDLAQDVKESRMFGFFDDFDWMVTVHRWTTLSSDTNATSIVSATLSGGVEVLHTGTVDNNESAIATSNKPFKIVASKPLFFEACVQFSEAATNAMNCCVGFSSVMNSANMLVDDGAGPVTTFDGAIIFKVDGGTVWKCASSRSTTQTISTSNATAGGTAQQTLRIQIQPVDTTTAEVTFYLNDQPLIDSTSGLPIKHIITYASAVVMQAGAYAKQGSATSEELNVDYIAAYQLR